MLAMLAMLAVLTPTLIVFDLDGTLIDSRRDLADATNAVIVEYGGTPLAVDDVTSMVGEGAAVLVRRALKAAGLGREDARRALDRFLEHYDARLTAHTRPYAGIPGALDTLRDQGRILAVLTNKPERPTRRILDALDLAARFSDVVGGDTSAGRKPDPAGLLQIMNHPDINVEPLFDVLAAMRHDKKVVNGTLHYVLCTGIGGWTTATDVTEEELAKALRKIRDSGQFTTLTPFR